MGEERSGGGGGLFIRVLDFGVSIYIICAFFSSHLNLISWFDCIPSLLDYRHSVHHWRGKRESKA